ncbi:DEAD-domain-containing protein [Lichtheimia hyalospora FSU 10163]|nr:DEAD-domain-containing protein [Lichtheimia hyalospora FSU 10163]
MLQNVRLATIHSTRLSFNAVNNATAEEIGTAAPLETAPKRFADLEAIDPRTQKAIKKVFKYDTMSTVQEAVLTRVPNTQDMFVKAKTGTGKTLAFLMAALETSIQKNDNLRYFEGSSILVVSPTRELASQIAVEAQKLTRFYPMKVHCLVGGESKRRQLDNLERGRADIIVATPGRLLDLLDSSYRTKQLMKTLKVVVLDEADQLVDMGFRADVERILKQVPSKRQTMLFSATLSPEIRDSLGKVALDSDYALIDTVGEDDVNTHLHVKQSALVVPYDQQLTYLRNLLDNYPAARAGKTIVFLPTTRSTMMYASLLKYLSPRRVVFELHSKKAQDQRSRIAQRFRKASPGAVLVTSDVSARGVDYPGVSLVVQIGVPSSREQYIHRLGRTGRAGKDGEGIIVLAPFEAPFIKEDLGDLPVQNLIPPTIEEKEQHETDKLVSYVRDKVIDPALIHDTYTAYLGYYAGRMQALNRPRSHVIKEAGTFIQALGVEQVPELSNRFMQLLGIQERAPKQPKRSMRNNRFGGHGKDRFSFDMGRHDYKRGRSGNRGKGDYEGHRTFMNEFKRGFGRRHND